jgi:hypothetical protein
MASLARTILVFLLAAATFGGAAASPSAGTGSGDGRKSLHAGKGFASNKKLTQHFRKHGREFGNITLDEYLRRAQELRDRPAGGPILEGVRRDRVITRFDRSSGAFIAFEPDFTIRTFFKPNNGEAYFHRQLTRGD